MKAYVFSLQAVLELRLRDEDDAKQELANKEAELRSYQELIQTMQTGLQDFQRGEKEERNHGRSVQEFRHSVSWRNKLKLDLLKKARQMQDVVFDVDRARNNLIECTKKRRGIEILKEKGLEKWQKERDRKDQLFMDELAQNAHIRKHRHHES